MVSTPWFELNKTAYSTTYIKPSKIRFLLASQDLQCCRFANTICAYQTKDLPWSWNWQPTIEGKKSFYFLIIIKVGRSLHLLDIKMCDVSVSRGLSRQGKKERKHKERDLCWPQPLPPTICVVTGFQNQFCLMWSVRALLRLHIKNFGSHSHYWVNQFCKLCRT